MKCSISFLIAASAHKRTLLKYDILKYTALDQNQ